MKLLDRLIEQAKNPNGGIGSLMLRIMNTAHTGMNKWALEKVEIKEAAVLLDVGCGGGKAIQLLSKKNMYGKLYGIDYSEQAVKNSIKTNKEDVEKGKVSIRQASVTDIPFAEDFFDVVTAFQTHYFWPDVEMGVKEVFRVLKPEGNFLLVAEVYKINYHMKSYKTKEEKRQLFKRTGFHSIEFHENVSKGWLCLKGVK
ncbi:class I SAM-dependent methyltransferase [Microbacteriaceae bacterium 4G12]